VLLLVKVGFIDGGSDHLYNVPVGIRRAFGSADLAPPDRIAQAGGTEVVDALRDEWCCQALLRLIAQNTTVDGVRLRSTAELELAGRAGGAVRPITAEQTNSSVVFGDRIILKLFRRIRPGVNPDLELTSALHRIGNAHVAGLLGAVETVLDGEPATLAMAQTYAPDSADAWEVARASLAAGGSVDFAPAAFHIGRTVGTIHLDLARSLGDRPMTAEHMGGLVAEMNADLDEAVATAPELRPYAAAVRDVYARAARAGSHAGVQRIHGDLHLGQILRTPTVWWVVDFEGEPARPLAQRRRLDSPLRDVASLLRSLAYAAHRLEPHGAARTGAASPERWVTRARHALLAGYASITRRDPRVDARLLRAFELARAVYEVSYEARHRRDWVDIPIDAVHRLSGI
jgi:maltokinase